MRKTAFPLAILLLFAFSSPGRILAQNDAPRALGSGPQPREVGSKLLGIAVGGASSRQLWSRTFSTEAAHGLSAAVFVEVPTPLSHLSVRAEAVYVGRASLVWDPALDPDRAGETTVRGHYLSLPIHGQVRAGLGPISLYGFGGPTVDLTLSTGCREDFCAVLRDEKPMTFGVGVGAGAALLLPNGMEGGVEVRLTEGLSSAYQGQSRDARWRTIELLLRVGVWR